LHETVGQISSDLELVDATKPAAVHYEQGMVATLGPYPHSGRILSAHSRALADRVSGRLEPGVGTGPP
jgi:hypothetical protein